MPHPFTVAVAIVAMTASAAAESREPVGVGVVDR
jgi:hypothetical protein